MAKKSIKEIEVAAEEKAKLPIYSSHHAAAHALKVVKEGKGGKPTTCYQVKDGTANHKTTQVQNEANDLINSGACTACGFDEELHALGLTVAQLGGETFEPAANGVGGTWR